MSMESFSGNQKESLRRYSIFSTNVIDITIIAVMERMRNHRTQQN